MQSLNDENNLKQPLRISGAAIIFFFLRLFQETLSSQCWKLDKIASARSTVLLLLYQSDVWFVLLL